ncbi:hypothetical protein MHYP_G00327620 [Metynnis hypsauchen]
MILQDELLGSWTTVWFSAGGLFGAMLKLCGCPAGPDPSLCRVKGQPAPSIPPTEKCLAPRPAPAALEPPDCARSRIDPARVGASCIKRLLCR